MIYLIIFTLGFLSGALSVVAWAVHVATVRHEEGRKEEKRDD